MPHRSGKNLGLHTLRYLTIIQHGVIARLRTIELVQLSTEDIRAKNEFLKSTGAADRRMGTGDRGPPEDGLEKTIVGLLLDESRTRSIEVEIGVPSSHLTCFFIIRISEMGTNNNQVWPVPRDQVKPRDPAPLKTDVGRLLRMQSIHDASVKKKNHVVLVGTIVDRPVCRIVIGLARHADFAQAAKPRSVKTIDLMENVRIIQLDITKTDEAVRMFLNKLIGLRKTLRSCQQECYAIRAFQFHEDFVQDPWFAVIMHMNIYKFWGMCLR